MATVRVIPTHRRQAGPLTVAVPAADGVNSDELVITDEGADIDEALANQLVAMREVELVITDEAPKAKGKGKAK